jgi:hypothetical protein
MADDQNPAPPPTTPGPAEKRILDVGTVVASVVGSGVTSAAGAYVGTKLAGRRPTDPPPPPTVILPPGADRSEP